MAAGEAPSTVEPPYLDASEGMRRALLQLTQITGRHMLDESARLITPASGEGNGTDVFLATASAGPPVRTLLVGLLPDVSVDSARRTAAQSYIQVVDSIHLADRRREDQVIDAVLAARPELIFITGGTDNGARDAVLKLSELVGLALHLFPPNSRLHVLYAGNPALAQKVDALLGGMATVKIAPNVHPALGEEVPGPARAALAEIFDQIRSAQIGGFADLAAFAGGHIWPTAQAEGHIIRFLSRTAGPRRTALGIDVGSASTVVAMAADGDLNLRVRTDLGMGVSAALSLSELPLDQFVRWVPREITPGMARDFILNKSVYPHTLPADETDLYLELALARLVMRAAVRQARPYWPRARAPRPDLLPWFDVIVGGGAALGHAPRPGLAGLALLDALQPVGVTNLILDQHHLLAALGTLAPQNPTAVAQLVGSGALLNIGTAVSVLGPGRPGQAVGKARLVYENGSDVRADIVFGSVEILPLPPGQTGRLTLLPRVGFDFGYGSGLRKTLAVRGGAVGVLIDARGRPILFPPKTEKRIELVQQWLWKVEGA